MTRPLLFRNDPAIGTCLHRQGQPEIDTAAEKKLLWKFDVRILPMPVLMYLFNGLDKGNLENAKTNGLTEDLGLVGDQYNILLSVSSSVGARNAKGIPPNAGV